MTRKHKAIVLLSGGLDSTVALGWAAREYDVVRALFFGYRHRAFRMEATAVTGIAYRYKLEITNVRLPFYAEALKHYSALSASGASDGNSKGGEEMDELRQVWVPNRNLVFVSIGAALAESLGCEAVVAGFNAEEAEQFPDNSAEFVARANRALELSTLSTVRLVCPLIELKKSEILKMGVELKIPFELIYSCYAGKKMWCGECMSCVRLKQAASELAASSGLGPELEVRINGRFVR